MRQNFFQIWVVVVSCGLVAACSTGPGEVPVLCKEGMCTPAPQKATSKPYQIKGVWYYPQPHYEYDETGIASYYGGGDVFHGRPTATGEIFDKNEVTAAHKTLPLPCIAVVTNLDNGRQIQLKINDRGPFIEGRIIDVSRRTAQLLGFENKGTAKVRVQTLVPESLALNGLDSSTVMLAQATPSIPAETLPAMASAASRLPDAIFEDQESALVLAEASQVPSLEIPTSRGIFVDVGGYDSHQEAHVLSQSLNDLTKSPAQPVQNNGSQPYAVRVGPFPNMLEANQVLDQLADAGHLMSRIVINH